MFHERPRGPDELNVAIDCTVITPGSDDADGSSYQVAPDLGSLRIEGEACERLAVGTAERIDVVFGCIQIL